MPMEQSSPPPGRQSSEGERLLWARLLRGYASPRKAAAALNLKEDTYRSHEAGRRGAIHGLKPYYVRRYAKAFSVSPVWLQTGAGSPTSIDPDKFTTAELQLIESFRAMARSA